jgi:pyruvate, orthophosphate dikinase
MSSMAELYAIEARADLAPGGAAEVGGKAWNLMRMVQAGMPVPPAFVLPTDWCGRKPGAADQSLRSALATGVLRIERATGLTFGGRHPLLLSVRSGAATSMPGMMETVLDVGLNADTVQGLIALTGNPRLAWDSYRRLIQGYAEVVAELPTGPFDALVENAKTEALVDSDRSLDHRSLRALSHAMLDCYANLAGSAFPADPFDQLAEATAAVFRSWDADKAVSYRRLNKLDDAMGTAVTVQTMVYGNAGGDSGAGVGFTRNPDTGAREFYFDFQFNAQGEDVVAGRHRMRDNDRLARQLPALWDRLGKICRDLEDVFGDAQDFEFTIQAGKLWLLQARRAKRTDWAAVVIAVDMVAEGVLTPDTGLALLADIDLGAVKRTSFAPPLPSALAQALGAGMGVASGAIALDTAAVQRLVATGSPFILVRHDTVTADIEDMALAAGILTATGGRTSHAAVVARQLGKVCVVACPNMVIDQARGTLTFGNTELAEGDFLSLDGNSGAVYSGRLSVETSAPAEALAKITTWRSAVAGLPG